MIPGGGFFGISQQDSLQMETDIPPAITFGGKLADSLSANVYVISYDVSMPDSIRTLLNSMVFTLQGTALTNCLFLKNETAKARMEEASYKSFRDLRKILKENYLDSASVKGIDTNNFYMIGSSAGAILTLNTLFLQQSEIASSITYKNNCVNNLTSTISIPSSVRNDYWPIPKMKGVIPMNGAWIYNESFLTANTPVSTFNTWLLLLHGTCDELVHRREGRIGFKKILGLSFYRNTFPESRYIKGYGSEIIFDAFKASHTKLRYGQVLEGGHAALHNSKYSTLGAWEVETPATNTVHPLTNQIVPFLRGLINNTLAPDVKAYTWSPEATTIHCKPFDEPLDTIYYTNSFWRSEDDEKSMRKDESSSWSIVLSPNPAKDFVNVKLNNSDVHKLEGTYPLSVVDTRGLIRHSSFIVNGVAEINAGNLDPGTYKVVIQIDREVVYGTLSVFK